MQLSDDGQWMWDGTQWVPAQQQPVQPVAQQPVQPTAQQPIQPMAQVYNQTGYMQQEMDLKPDRKIVPWIGVGLIVLSLFLPYISVLGFGVSGFEMIGFIGEVSEGSDAFSDDGGSEDIGLTFGESMFVLSAILMVFSPIVYLLSALIGGILIATKRSLKIPAIIHLGYFGLLLISATLGTIDIFEEDLSVIGFVGIGFYMGSLGPTLWFVDK